MSKYIAIVREKETGKLEKIESESYTSMKDFKRDLRGNGYAVQIVSTPEKFDEVVDKKEERREQKAQFRKYRKEAREEMKFVDCAKIDTAIDRAIMKLEKEAQENGLYENFGQNEYRAIKDKFIDLSDYSPEMNKRRDQLESFAKWAGNYSLKNVK